MAKVNALVNSFNAGEISVDALARIDQDKVRLAAEIQENLFPYTIGKAIMRPGLKHLGIMKSSTSIDNYPPRIIPFIKSINEKFVLELTYEYGGAPTTQTVVYDTAGYKQVLIDPGVTSASIVMIGASQAAGTSGNGSGGGAYVEHTVSLTPGSILYLHVGETTSTDTWVNVNANTPPSSEAEGCLAKGGSGQTGGTAAASIGTTKYSGGDGGSKDTRGGGGGGGAGGPNGNGAAGGNGKYFISGSNNQNGYGGGGGGNGGGSPGANATSSHSGAGGNNFAGIGGGASDTDGTVGGGGGGSENPVGGIRGGDGGNGIDIDGSRGSGGGGGGSGFFWGGDSGNPYYYPGGGDGGLYGGGAGGSGSSGFANSAAGARGVIIITYTVAATDGRLKVWQNDTLISYTAVTCTIDAPTGWTDASSGGASVTPTATGFSASAPALGGKAILKHQNATSSAGSEHAVKIIVTAGETEFRIGSTDGGDDYFAAATLGVGTHILSFTPNGSFWLRFLVTSTTTSTVSTIAIYNSTDIDLSVPAPWQAGDFRKMRYDQSLDIVFITVPDSIPQKIERWDDRSWSVSEYRAIDGPLDATRRNTNVRLSPGATSGNTTLTADNAFFYPYHEGCLFKLTHGNFHLTQSLGAAGFYTEAWEQSGIFISGGVDDRAFSVVVSGTWVGTINIQRSFTDQYSGFNNYGANIVANGTTNVTGATADNNTLVWYRVIFTTYTSGSATIAVSYNGYRSSGICRVTSYTSSTSVDVEVLKPFGDVAYTDDWQQGEWNSNDGFPTAVALFDGRLWWARRDRFWGSVSDAYYSFDTSLGDSAAIARAIATGGEFSDIQWILPLQRLIFGTTGAEASARASSLDEPLKATAITVKDGSNQGSANLSPIKIDGRGAFVQRSGSRLLELGFFPQTNDYSTIDVTRYNADAGVSLQGVRIPNLVEADIVELSFQRFPETYIWMVRDDGVMMGLLYNPQQEGLGWFKLLSGQSYAGTYGTGTGEQLYLPHDRILSVATLPEQGEDIVYVVVQRRMGPDNVEISAGDPVYYYAMEKIGAHSTSIYAVGSDPSSGSVTLHNGLYQLDSWETQVVASDAVTVTASDRFSNCIVDVIGPFYDSAGSVQGYGPIGGPYTLSGDTIITLDEYSQYRGGATVAVGLPYTGRYKSVKLAYAAQSGTALLQRKRIGPVGLMLTNYNPRGVKIGSDFDDSTSMDDLPRVERGVPVTYDAALVTELDSDVFPFSGIWDTDSRVCIRVDPGYSATLNALVIGVETHEK